jgi:hypothetical protein
VLDATRPEEQGDLYPSQLTIFSRSTKGFTMSTPLPATRDEARDFLLMQPKDYILNLFGVLNGTGKPGFDHERTRKGACIDKLMSEYTITAIRDAIFTKPAPVADATPRELPALPASAPAPSAGAAQALDALRAVLGVQVDEAKVREIVLAEVNAALAQNSRGAP